VVAGIGNGQYTRDTLGLQIGAGKKYQLEVRVPGFDRVVSDWATVPVLTTLDSIQMALDGGFNGDTPTAQGFFSLRDTRPADDFYFFEMLGIADDQVPMPANPGIDLSNNCKTWFDYTTIVFGDRCATSNGLIGSRFRLDAGAYNTTTMQQVAFRKIRFRVGNVESTYRDFLEAFEQPEEWENGLVEPKITFSNLQNAWGVFYASHTYTFELNL
jgi:hypothetical protein